MESFKYSIIDNYENGYNKFIKSAYPDVNINESGGNKLII